MANGTDRLSMRLPHTASAADTANMLALKPDHSTRVSDTRKKWPIYVNWKTGQFIGRSRACCGRTTFGPPNGRASGMSFGLLGLSIVRSAARCGHRFDAGARRRAPRDDSIRAGDLQPLRPRRGSGGNRRRDLPHPGQADSRQSRDRRARAVAGRGLDRVGRQPDLHDHDQAGPEVLGRAADDVGRRAVLVSRRVRRRRGEPARLRAERPRQAARRHRAGRAHGRRQVSRAVRAGPAPPRQPADPAEAHARRGARRQAVPDPLGSVTPGQRGRRPRAVSARRARRRAAARVRAQPALLPARRGRRPAAVPRSA